MGSSVFSSQGGEVPAQRAEPAHFAPGHYRNKYSHGATSERRMESQGGRKEASVPVGRFCLSSVLAERKMGVLLHFLQDLTNHLVPSPVFNENTLKFY